MQAFLRDLAQAFLFAATIAAPFVLYFWNMAA